MSGKETAATKIVLAAASVFLLAAGIVSARYSGGDGSPENPYRIDTPNDLNDIGNHVEDFNKHFVMVNDINLAAYTGTQFNIIGPNATLPFSGVFDGNGHTVSNLTWSSTGKDCIGMFGYAGMGGYVKNLGVADANIDAGTGYYVAVLVGFDHQAVITGCLTTGRAVGGSYVGGAVGYLGGGILRNSSSSVTLSGDYFVAGLVGQGYGAISTCQSGGSVFGSGDYIGGLVGETSDGTIANGYPLAVVDNEW